jgi:hypothetical protein
MPFDKLRATVGGQVRATRKGLARAGAERPEGSTFYSSPPQAAVLSTISDADCSIFGARYNRPLPMPPKTNLISVPPSAVVLARLQTGGCFPPPASGRECQLAIQSG